MAAEQGAGLPEHLADPARYGGEPTALVLVDGEHHPAAVLDALQLLRQAGWDLRAAILIGGTEKLRGRPDYGLLTYTADTAQQALHDALAASSVAWLIDCADEPALVSEVRMEMIALAAAAGVNTIGADSVFFAPRFQSIATPTLAVTGTGKRIGKTAIGAHVARLASRELDGSVALVAMGRGGPAEPVLVDARSGPVTVDDLLELSRAGRHGASDYLEDAVLGGISTVGCRRVGGGLLGSPVTSNVVDGVHAAAALAPRLIVIEGSGSCRPPVRADATLLVASTRRPRDLLDDFSVVRLEPADLVLIVGGEDESAQLAEAVRQRHPSLEVVTLRLATRPATPPLDLQAMVCTTAPIEAGYEIRAELHGQGVDVGVLSHNLADRPRLIEDLRTARTAGAQQILVEIKAAAIDVVAEFAQQHDMPLTFLDNVPVGHSGDLDPTLVEIINRCASPA